MAFSQEEYLRQQTSDSLGENMFNALFNLSFLLGDEKGRITRSTAEAALVGVQILPPGVVVASDIMETTLPVGASSALPRESFMTEISHKAYQVYIGLHTKDETMVNDSIANKSIVLINSAKLRNQLRSGINVIYLEALAVYQELLLASVSTGVNTITKSDITRIDNNIRYVTMLMEDDQDTLNYELLEQLRVLQRTLLYIRYQDFLFVNTYNDRVIELQSYMSEVREDIDL